MWAGSSSEERLLARNRIIEDFFSRNTACEPAARFERFLSGAAYSHWTGPYATDAQHVSVEFVHL